MSKSRQKRGFKRIDTREVSRKGRSKDRSKDRKGGNRDYRPVRSRKSTNSADTTFKNPKPKRKKSNSTPTGQGKKKK